MFSDIITAIDKISQIEQENRIVQRVKPAVDIYETDQAIVLWAEMPNVDKKDLHVQIDNSILHIKGKRSSSLDKGQYLLRESSDVSYERFFELRENLDPKKIEASYQAGILKITLTKREETQPKIIAIK
jgi:HSP20 family protein